MSIAVKSLAILILFFSTIGYSEEEKPLDKTLQKVASDLATLQQKIQSAYQNQAANAGNDKDFSAKSVDITTEKGKGFAGVLTSKTKDLGTVGDYRALASASTTQPSKSNMEVVYEKILLSVKELKDKYETNPYVIVNGFSIDIGMPPSVNISFEFKPVIQPRRAQ